MTAEIALFHAGGILRTQVGRRYSKQRPSKREQSGPSETFEDETAQRFPYPSSRSAAQLAK